MDTRFSDEDEAFRREIAGWLADSLRGDFEKIRGRGGPGDEHAFLEERLAWERELAAAGWTCVGWPEEHGGRGLSLEQQVIFYEEYARAGGPGRANHVGETLLGPTIVAFGTPAQKAKFLPGIVSGTEIWCQGYSEPNAGSDLANVQTKARLEGDEWIVDGQKVWTSWGAWADWCFVVARTDPASQRHKGLSYLLVPMKQPGVEPRPILQMTGTSEFCEVFFNGARTAKDHIVGEPGQGWAVAMGTLAFERGASTLGQQLQFTNELAQIIAIAKRNGKAEDPVMRQRIADAWIGLQIMRGNAMRTLSSTNPELSREGTITKIFWATWHRELGKLYMDVMGPEGEIAAGFPYELSQMQRMYLFVRSDTIYAGSNQIQRNIISERALGLPREPRP
ncbi:MAG: acyl-CoA dehydrogenase family protein [Myxococcales bacterium]|nr:acyl-CoA dehydrogenase family protein [Myxococcales bacterium]